MTTPSHTCLLGDRVTLHYRLRCGGQDIADTWPDEPETFLLGAGEIDPRLEWHLQGLVVGERRHLALEPWQAFGERDEALVQRLPRGEFTAWTDMAPGHRAEFPLPNGDHLAGTILALEDEVVVVDFNHPLAGLPVELDVELIALERPEAC